MKGRVKDSAINIGGNVSVKTIDHGVVVKTEKYNNHATVQLFYGMLRFLRGDFANAQFVSAETNFIPYYLGVSSTKKTYTAADASLDGELQITKRFDVVPGSLKSVSNTVKLTLTTFITSNVVAGEELKSLGLFTVPTPGQGVMLAVVDITDESGNGRTIRQGQSLQVDWEITLGNKEE